MKIGIFGGTFDPPHLGHKKYGEEAVERLSLDKLIVIPTFIPPHKSFNGASGEDRLAMTKALFDGNPRITVSALELERGGKSYTCETVKLLREKYPEDELIFLVGSDMLLSFHTWREPEHILDCVRLCAVSRNSSTGEAELKRYIDTYFKQRKDRFIICSFEPIELSSTQVRNSVKSGEPIEKMTGGQVEKYIKEKELYL